MAKYEEYFDLLTAAKHTDDEFRWSVQQLRELYAERRTGEVVTRSMEVLTRGIVEGTGEGKRELRGHADARAFLLSGLAEIERELSAEVAPEGDMRAEGRQIKEDYAPPRGAACRRGRGGHRHSGAGRDAGRRPAARRAEPGGRVHQLGQDGAVLQFAWHAVTQQGRNVVIFTSETLRSQVRFRILARHSRRIRSSASMAGSTPGT